MVALNLTGEELDSEVMKSCAVSLKKNVGKLSTNEKNILEELLSRINAKGVKHLEQLSDALK